MSYLQTALGAGGLGLFWGIQNHFPPAVLGCTLCLNPCLCNGSGSGCPSSPCLLSAEGTSEGREGAAAFTNQSANGAGRAEHPLCDYTALHCSPCLTPALINTSGANKNTEMREKIWPLLLANLCLVGKSCDQCISFVQVTVRACVEIRDCCATPVALAPPEGKVQPSVFIRT